jgi:hypothetical protein
MLMRWTLNVYHCFHRKQWYWPYHRKRQNLKALFMKEDRDRYELLRPGRLSLAIFAPTLLMYIRNTSDPTLLMYIRNTSEKRIVK